MYKLIFAIDWDTHFNKLDTPVRTQIWKKIQKQKAEIKNRHLKYGLDFFVAECGQYRIALKINELEQIKTIWFVGDHKQYDKWRKSQR